MSNHQSRNSKTNRSTDEAGQQAEFFDLHVRGCGYLSRVRWAQPSKKAGRRSEPFLCCAINALHGDVNEPSYSYFDLRVSGSEAHDLVLKFEEAVAKKHRVFVAFKVGDIYAHSYEREVKDQRTGKVTGKEIAGLIKGRLLQITHVKVDGEVVFSKENDASPEADIPNESQEFDQKTGTDD